MGEKSDGLSAAEWDEKWVVAWDGDWVARWVSERAATSVVLKGVWKVETWALRRVEETDRKWVDLLAAWKAGTQAAMRANLMAVQTAAQMADL